jgi:membrane associated rhomboid family serine protease
LRRRREYNSLVDWFRGTDLLILPLHRSLSRSNFPLLTVLLIIANIFVFAFLQSGDAAVERRAVEYYQQTGLGEIEFPAYLAWLREHGGDPHKIEFTQSAPAPIQLNLIESDEAFMAALHADRVIAPTNPDYSGWHEKRAEFDRILDSTFTSSHAIRFSHVEPGRMLWAMFMHGGFDHILGNMIFLAILGMLVEGALGPWWFLGLYFIGGIGAGMTTTAFHWGNVGNALGASGAIAALTGAYCVIWGLRKVRVFYWFFVVFDYVKVPALVLLPFWFGWLVLYPWISGGNIDFAAHGGGLVCGAALAFVLRRYGRVRDAFVEEDERVDQRERDEAAFELAQRLIGQLDIPKARELLQRIDKAEPGQLRVLVALYRCARYRGTPEELDAAAVRVLGFAAISDADMRELKTVYGDYVKACAGAPRLAPGLLMGLLPLLQRLGDDAALESLLRDVTGREPQFPGLPAAWLAVALRAPDGSVARRTRLEYLLQHFAQSDYAPKARFLLGQG